MHIFQSCKLQQRGLHAPLHDADTFIIVHSAAAAMHHAAADPTTMIAQGRLLLPDGCCVQVYGWYQSMSCFGPFTIGGITDELQLSRAVMAKSLLSGQTGESLQTAANQCGLAAGPWCVPTQPQKHILDTRQS